jgi:hypothetical protein
MFAVGNSTTTQQDSLPSTVDIGSTGGGNNWDFTMLVSNLSVSLESIDPASSPYIGDFPGANICTYSLSTVGGNQFEIWSYSTINGAFDVLGNAAENSIVPGFITTIKNDPYRRQFEHPMTINSQWSHSFTQNLFINGTPINSSSASLNVVVDAYGTMTIPGGASYDALRIRDEMTISGFTAVSYNFVAKNGAQVSVFAVGANPPTSGTINVDGTSYNGSMTTTGVEQISGLPNDYSLSQNYPNPFNPSTSIEYSIPENSFVELKVYDVLGNEVAALVNEQQPTGVYQAEFTADNLPSGMYIARLTANEHTQIIKMTLLK